MVDAQCFSDRSPTRLGSRASHTYRSANKAEHQRNKSWKIYRINKSGFDPEDLVRRVEFQTSAIAPGGILLLLLVVSNSAIGLVTRSWYVILCDAFTFCYYISQDFRWIYSASAREQQQSRSRWKRIKGQEEACDDDYRGNSTLPCTHCKPARSLQNNESSSKGKNSTEGNSNQSEEMQLLY